ncbi:MAG TPA: hypothetical protein VL688_09175 [Verrucomicrobiae bacterium]|jgi:hypothetical protein|nr:hypothetical protein [Verrucomicrobiae bacterium]
MADPTETPEAEPPQKPKRQRELIEPGEPDNKAFATIMIIAAVLVLGGFALFMVFCFQGMFFEKIVAAK